MDFEILSKEPPIELMNRKDPYCITVCSGKGGVGKSVLTANIGGMLADRGYKVLIWDTDIKTPNIHLLFGVEPPVRTNDIIEQDIPIGKAIYAVSENLCILSGRAEQIPQNGFYDDNILVIYEQLLINTDFDFIFLDTQAGASETVLKCCSIADTTALVVTDEPTSLVDAYVLVKLLLPYIESRFIKLIVNNCIDDEDADDIVEKINLATGKFLNSIFEPVGKINYDRIVRQSIIQQKLFTSAELSGDDRDIIDEMEQLVNNILQLSGVGASSTEHNF